jgi:hypothetical protein
LTRPDLQQRALSATLSTWPEIFASDAPTLSLRGAERRGNPAFAPDESVDWIASLRSQ